MDLKYKSKRYILQWNAVVKMERIDVEKTNPLTSGVYHCFSNTKVSNIQMKNWTPISIS